MNSALVDLVQGATMMEAAFDQIRTVVQEAHGLATTRGEQARAWRTIAFELAQVLESRELHGIDMLDRQMRLHKVIPYDR